VPEKAKKRSPGIPFKTVGDLVVETAGPRRGTMRNDSAAKNPHKGDKNGKSVKKLGRGAMAGDAGEGIRLKKLGGKGGGKRGWAGDPWKEKRMPKEGEWAETAIEKWDRKSCKGGR